MLQDQWDFYKSTYLKGEQALARQALAPMPVAYEQAMASQDLSQSFAKQQGIATRTAARYGAPAPTTTDTGSEMIRRAAEIGARNTLQGSAQDRQLSRMNAVMELGMNMAPQAISSNISASGMQSGLDAAQSAARTSLVNTGLNVAGGAIASGTGGSMPSVWTSGKNLFKAMNASSAIDPYASYASDPY